MSYEKFCRYMWLAALRMYQEQTGATQAEAVEYLSKVTQPSEQVLCSYWNDNDNYEKCATHWLDWLETPADSHIAECAFH